VIDIIQNVSSLNRGYSNLPKNHANLTIYRKLLRIDMQLGVSETEQLFACLQFTFSIAYLKELVYTFIMKILQNSLILPIFIPRK